MRDVARPSPQRTSTIRMRLDQPAARPRQPVGRRDLGALSRGGAGIVDLLLELRVERRMTIVMATHDGDVAARCDRVVRLLGRRVVDEVDRGG
jgi:predicted ABC-type transport system involved in lysophospholipase L1 biosynthesis ATPase subunit